MEILGGLIFFTLIFLFVMIPIGLVNYAGSATMPEEDPDLWKSYIGHNVNVQAFIDVRGVV